MDDEYWICKLSRKFPGTIFHEFPLRLSPYNYISILCAKTDETTGCLLEEKEVIIREEIKRFPSTDEFESIQTRKNLAGYKIAVDDIKYKTSPIRILASIKEVDIYRFVSNPAISGVQYLNAYFPDIGMFEKSTNILEEEFHVLRDDGEFCVKTADVNNILSEFPDVFKVIAINEEDAKLLKKICNCHDKEGVLEAENDESLFSLAEKYPVLKEIIEIVLNISSIIGFFGNLR